MLFKAGTSFFIAGEALLAKMRYGASISPHLKFEAWQILEEQGLFQDLPE